MRIIIWGLACGTIRGTNRVRVSIQSTAGLDLPRFSGQLTVLYSLSSAELFDPTMGTFTATADMTVVRESHTATLLNTGDVLVVGGSNGTLGYSTTTTVYATAELYR